MSSLKKHRNNPPSPHIPGIFRIVKKSGPSSFTSPTSVEAECWQTSRVVAKRLFDTEHDTTSAHHSDRTEFSLNDFSVDEMCSLSNSPLNASTEIETDLWTQASRDCSSSDDDASTESEGDYFSYKRRWESDEDVRKPAAKRPRFEKTKSSFPFDNRGSPTNKMSKINCVDAKPNKRLDEVKEKPQFESQNENVKEARALQKNNVSIGDQSTATINTARPRGNNFGGLCGRCSTCMNQEKCKECKSCRKFREGRCAFRPCLKTAYKPATLKKYRNEARTAKSRNKSLKDKFEALYGKNGALAARLKVVDQSALSTCGPSKKAGGRCGKCSSCADPISCRECITCLGRKKGKCIFALCLAKDYSTRTLNRFRKEANSIKVGNKQLEDKFVELYGGSSVFASQFIKEAPVSGVKDIPTPKRRCETCTSFTSSLKYGKCRACRHMTTCTLKNEHQGHFLMKQGFYHEWINHEGKRKAAFGTFVSCVNDEGVLHFSIELDLSVGTWLAFGVRNEAPNPPLLCVEEADAWAGYLSFVAQTEGRKYSIPSDRLPREIPIHRHYIVPTVIHSCSQQRTIELVVKGYRLKLKVKESKIPKGGLGLFVKAEPIASLKHREKGAAFVLEEGELVDLGVYGPLRTEDLKPDHVVIVKRFIHNKKSEKWSFEAFGDPRLVFDITDDDTGNLSKLAEKNILVFTNETNGKDIPAVFAKNDPEGAMHYYLGHNDCGQGPLLIPTDGTEMELKIDYGPKYEMVRVRNGYSRLSGQKLKEARMEAYCDEKDMLNDLSKLTTGEISDIYSFLEKLNSSWTDSKTTNDRGPVGRAMLVALLLLCRVKAINNREDSAGEHVWLVQSLHRQSLAFFDLFDYAANRSFILNEGYADLFSSALGFSVIKSSWDNTYSIRLAIENLTK
jgi:hypothetical protein